MTYEGTEDSGRDPSGMNADRVIDESSIKVSESPKEAIHAGELPNGVTDEDGNLLRYIEFWEITGEEEDILASRKIPPQKRLNKILENCVLKIGHLTEKADIRRLLQSMIYSDRMYCMVQIRITSLGPVYSFRQECREESCKHKYMANIDLNDIRWEAMKDPTKRQLSITVDGVKYNWNVMDGRREEKIGMMNMEKDLLSVGIYARLNTINDSPVTMDAVKKMGQRIRMTLREEFKKNEPDVDDEIEFDCPQCGYTWKEGIDFAQASFFFPLDELTS